MRINRMNSSGGKVVKANTPNKVKKPNKFSKSDLEKMSFNDLKEIGKKYGTTDRSSKKLIEEILELQ